MDEHSTDVTETTGFSSSMDMDLKQSDLEEDDDADADAFHQIELRDYQKSLFEKAIHSNLIITLPTGTGKTMIAISLIRHFLHQTDGPFPTVARRTVFIAPTRALVHQQYEAIKSMIPVPVAKIHSNCGHVLICQEHWDQFLEQYKILVFTPACLSIAITRGYLKYEHFNLMIFDEAHWALRCNSASITGHCKLSYSYYAQILEKLRKQTRILSPEQRPRILAMSASIFNSSIVNLQLIKQTINSIEALFQAKIASEETSVYVKQANVFVTFVDDGLFETNLAYGKSNSEDPFITAVKRVDQFVPESARAQPLKNAFFNVRAICYKTMGPWFAIEALELYKQSLTTSSTFESLVIPLKQLFTQTQFMILQQFCRPNWSPIDFAIHSPRSEKLTAILKYFTVFEGNLNCIIFVYNRLMANVIYRWIKLLAESLPQYSNIKSGFICGISKNTSFLRYDANTVDFKKQFEQQQLNLMVATSVLEEGIDVPVCNVVIRYDFPETYRAFVQSRGRARDVNSYYLLLVDEKKEVNNWKKKLEEFAIIGKYFENLIKRQMESREMLESQSEPSIEEVPSIVMETAEVDDDPSVRTKTGAELTERIAGLILNAYLFKLPADIFTEKHAIFKEIEKSVEHSNAKKYCYVFTMPGNSSLTGTIFGQYRTNKREAKMNCCFEVCKLLYEKGEIDDSLKVINSVTLLGKHREELKLRVDGKFKAKQISKIQCEGYNSQYFTQLTQLNRDEFPANEFDLFNLYVIEFHESTKLFGFQANNHTVGFLTSLLDPLPADYIQSLIYRFEDKVKFTVSAVSTIELDDCKKQAKLIKFFHYHVIENVIWNLGKNENAKTNSGWIADLDLYPDLNFYLVPLVKSSQSYEVDFGQIEQLHSWMHQMSDLHENRKKSKRCLTKESVAEMFQPDTLVGAHHRSSLVLISVTSNNLTILPSDTFELYKSQKRRVTFPQTTIISYIDYFERNYGITLQNPDLPLVCGQFAGQKNAQHWKFSLVYRVSQSSADDSESSSCLKFPPELLCLYPMSIGLVRMFNALPPVFWRLEQFLIGQEFLKDQFCTGEWFDFNQQLDVDLLINKQNSINWNVTKQSGVLNTPRDYQMIRLDQIVDSCIYTTPTDSSILQTTVLPDGAHLLENVEQTLTLLQKSPKLIEFQRMLANLQHWAPMMNNNDRLENISVIPTVPFGMTSIFQYTGPIESYIDFTFDTYNTLIYPNPWYITKALTLHRADDIWSHEQLETIGDAFLKMSTVLYLFFKFPEYDEGKLSTLKGALVCNEQLGKLAQEKNLQIFVNSEIISTDQLYSNPLFYSQDDGKNHSVVLQKELKSKDFADCVKALIGAMVFYGSAGLALKVFQWLNMVTFEPKAWIASKQLNPVECVQEELEKNWNKNHFEYEEDVVMATKEYMADIQQMVGAAYAHYKMNEIEHKTGYCFKDKYFLVQAFTHPTYSQTESGIRCYIASYQRLQFIGDSILDYLVTYGLAKQNQSLTNEQITSIRSVLVSNEFIASLLVKYNLHSHIRLSDRQLHEAIQCFVVRFKYQAVMQFVQMIPGNSQIAEPNFTTEKIDEVDVPKVLADVFEALVGAIYIDSRFSLDTAWKVIYKMMKVEFDYFLEHQPQNPINWLNTNYLGHYRFSEPFILTKKKIILTVDLDAERAETFTGYGQNKHKCQMAAARQAMNKLGKRIQNHQVPMDEL